MTGMMTTTNGSVDQGEISVAEQVTIMIVTTAIEFACGFGLIALFVIGWYDIIDGSLSERQLLALPLSFGLTLITGYKAMMLIVRPTRPGMVTVAALAIASLLPEILVRVL